MSELMGAKRSIVSNAGGQIEWLVKVGDLITADQVVCLVIAKHPEYRLVRSPYAGQVIDLVVANKLYLNANQIVAWILQTEPRSRPIVVDPVETEVKQSILISSRPTSEPDYIPGLDKSRIKIGPSRFRRPPIKIGGEDSRTREDGRVHPFIC